MSEELTIQGVGKDNHLRSDYPNENNGTSPSLWVGFSNYPYICRGLIEFPIVWGTDIPAGATIISAVLSLNLTTVYGTDNYTASRLLRLDWSELQSTWSIYKTGSNWGTAGCDNAITDYTPTDAVAISIGSTGWKDWVITEQVKTAQSLGINVGIRVAGATVSGGLNKRIYAYSKEYGTATDRPKLVITYELPVDPPTVTTQAVSDIAPVTATGNGNMTDNGGENASKRGVCWNTTGNPTVADSKSEETDSFGVGAFTRPMTGLTPGQLYYVRAYAYNSAGYGYGGQVEFTTKTYYATGYIGDVIDCTELLKTYDRLEWTEEIPSPEQAIEIKIRSSPDLSTWTDWAVIYSSPCTSFTTPVQRYLEWVATLTTDQSDTPKLKDLAFFWTKKVE